jgi:hypothetical protein
METIENKIYSTTDLYLASYLKLKEYKFEVEKKGNKVHFNFFRNEQLNSHVVEYLNESGQCNPLKYANSIKNLKNLIYNL